MPVNFSQEVSSWYIYMLPMPIVQLFWSLWANHADPCRFTVMETARFVFELRRRLTSRLDRFVLGAEGKNMRGRLGLVALKKCAKKLKGEFVGGFENFWVKPESMCRQMLLVFSKVLVRLPTKKHAKAIKRRTLQGRFAKKNLPLWPGGKQPNPQTVKPAKKERTAAAGRRSSDR